MPRFPAALSAPRAATLVAVLALLASLMAAGPARASSPPAQWVTDLSPAYGAVVPHGTVFVAATLTSPNGFRAAEVRVDGAVVASRVEGSGTRRRITATPRLAAGHHLAEAIFKDADGRTTRRAWRFGVSALPVTRLAGTDRVATAVAISRDLYRQRGLARAAVLARADQFADALAGAPVAAATVGPLLLTGHSRLDARSRDELGRLLLPGATVYLLGGTAALSTQVEADVKALGFLPHRVQGGDRYTTAAAAARLVPPGAAAMVASGGSFPDALAASSPAARDRMPILLASRDRLHEPTRRVLAERGYARVYVVGGPAVISDQVVAAIDAVAGEVVRLAGRNRYETAAVVGNRFYVTARAVAVASGDRFPDALAGGPHAAAVGGPLLLSPATRLQRPQVDQVAGKQPARAYLYGGRSVLPDTIGQDVRAAALDRGGPREVGFSPAPGGQVTDLDALQVDFSGNLDRSRSHVYVELAGREIYGAVTQGDFPNSLVFRVVALPIEPVPYEVYPLKVHALAFDGDGWRHVRYQLTFRTLDLSRGDSGPKVRELQTRLTQLGYWLGRVDGQYGALTVQAVMAFQKVHGLPRTGSVDERTRGTLARATRPRPRTRSGRWVEIDKRRQVLLFVDDGHVTYTFNTSTGTEQPYRYEGRTYIADTPEGTFRITREIDGLRESRLGTLWRPKYFTDRGHAIHGSTNVPAYPASHGCVRLTYAAIDFVWAAGLAPIGTRVLVY